MGVKKREQNVAKKGTFLATTYIKSSVFGGNYTRLPRHQPLSL